MHRLNPLLRSIVIWSLLYYLRFWAKIALLIHWPVIIGVAGSVGKSSTKEALVAMLQDNTTVTSTYGNSETGVPLGILGIEARASSVTSWLRIIILCPISIFHLRPYRYLVVEMGTDEPEPPKNMDYLLTIVKPNISLLLNTFPIHTQQFASVLDKLPATETKDWDEDRKLDYIVTALAAEDAKIITANPGAKGIYNADNRYVAEQMLSYLEREPLAELQNYGSQPDSDLNFGAYIISPSGSQFELIRQGQVLTVTVDNYLLPQEYREVFAAALLAGMAAGFEPDKLVASLKQRFHLPKGRSSVFNGIKDSIIIDSSYNASTTAVTAFIAMIGQLKSQTGRPAVLLLGDMRELGPAAETEHRLIADAAAEVADAVYCVGPLTKQYLLPRLQELKPGLATAWFATSVEAGQKLKEALPDKALVLAKGSQNTIFLEEAVKQILADSTEFNRLCRQEPHWLIIKERFFTKPK